MGIHEECGVFGIYSEEKRFLASEVYLGLFALQHRGQEAAGIAINEDRVIRYHKGLGLVHEVFDKEGLRDLGMGQIAVGHVRYSTSGSNASVNAQPMVVKHIKGQLALCHNGNLTNSSELRKKLELDGCIFQTTSDTEVISYIMIQKRLVTPSIEDAVCQTMNDLDGAYSLVMMSPSKLIAARDPHGFRPLVMGKKSDGSVVFASETCALDSVQAEYVRDVEPGEIIVVSKDGMRSIRTHCGKKRSLCVFEYIYFARPDSVVEGQSVQEARKRAGRYLARSFPADADIVIGVPDSGLDAALGYSEESGIPYGIGLIRNKYVGRTFIAPEEAGRGEQVQLKLNPVPSAVAGKRVVLIDDSIVRGTTSREILRLLREAGAKEIHMRISSPPFLYPCFYGTDVDSSSGLIAKSHTVAEISDIIGADSLGFLSMEDALSLAPGIPSDQFCSACFDGVYPTSVPEETAKSRFE
ncbi:MAG: amidophosphoribosyltransferase [Clostridiales bacterium]|nr:amidophosphoribosyltransferase [Clostridiales bacterium]